MILETLKRLKATCAQAPVARIQRSGVSDDADPAIAQLAQTAWALKRRLDDLRAQLAQINDVLAKELGDGAAILLPGEVRITVAARETVVIGDIKGLYSLLGARTEDLVEETVKYKPTAKLLRLADDADFPRRDELRGFLKFSEDVTVTYRPLRGSSAS